MFYKFFLEKFKTITDHLKDIFFNVFYFFNISDNFNNSNKKIYLDNASITWMSEDMLNSLKYINKKYFANPSSIHSLGINNSKKLSECRNIIAKTLTTNKYKIHEDEIIFTSGGTEGNNMLLNGFIESKKHENNLQNDNSKIIVITSKFEHPSVKKYLNDNNSIQNIEIDILDNGIIDIIHFEKIISTSLDKNILISIMLVNNELGTIQPIKKLRGIIKKYKFKYDPIIITDACQALAYLDFDFYDIDIDAAVFDSGKFYGPHGTGFVYIKRNKNTLQNFKPLFIGGDQEFGLRAGTENLPNIILLTNALIKIKNNIINNIKKYTKFKNYIIQNIDKRIIINGSIENDKCVNGILNINLSNIIDSKTNIFSSNNKISLDSEYFLQKLDFKGFLVSTGTTCQNKKENSESVSVKALKGDASTKSLRISFGQNNTFREIKSFVKTFNNML